jgi:hypothetical protein
MQSSTPKPYPSHASHYYNRPVHSVGIFRHFVFSWLFTASLKDDSASVLVRLLDSSLPRRPQFEGHYSIVLLVKRCFLLLMKQTSIKCFWKFILWMQILPITVAARSKAWTVFACSNTGIVGSNPTRGMDVCVRLFCVCVVLCVGSGLAMG